MKDLVDRFLKQQRGNKPAIVDVGLETNQPESALTMDLSTRRLVRVAKNSLRRIYQPGSKAVIALQWHGTNGQARLLKYALELAQTEYREGFTFSGHLGLEQRHVVNEATVSWVPVQLTVLLNRRCGTKKNNLPYGVASYCNDYSYCDLDGVKHRGTDPYALHLAFINERRQILVAWMEGDVGPKTKKLLAAKVARVDTILARGEVVDYI